MTCAGCVCEVRTGVSVGMWWRYGGCAVPCIACQSALPS